MLVGVPCKGRVTGRPLDTLFLLVLVTCSVLVRESEGVSAASSSGDSDSDGLDTEKLETLFNQKFKACFGLSSSSFEDPNHKDSIESSEEHYPTTEVYNNLFPVPIKVASHYNTPTYPSVNHVHKPNPGQLKKPNKNPQAQLLKSQQKRSSGSYYSGGGNSKRPPFGDISSNNPPKKEFQSGSNAYKPKGGKARNVITVKNPQNELTDDEIVEMLRNGGYDLSKTELRVVDKSGMRIIKTTNGERGFVQNYKLSTRDPYWDLKSSTTSSTVPPLRKVYIQPLKETEKHTEQYPDSYVYIGSHNQIFPDPDSNKR